MSDLLTQYQINPDRVPQHVAIIMDGNGRWAKQKGHMRIFGHRQGVKAVRAAIESAAEMGVKYLTLYAFSTENWTRPEQEVNALMELLVDTIESELPTLMKNNIKLSKINMEINPMKIELKIRLFKLSISNCLRLPMS